MEEEFRDLYNMYAKKLYTFLYYLVGSHQLAEELLQETFYQALLSFHRYKAESKVSTWLYQIAKFTTYKYMKKNKNIRLASIDELSKAADPNGNPELIYLQQENCNTLEQAIRSLGKEYKDVAVLRLLNEMSFKEIGEVLNHSENWARVTFYRAKLQLQKEMGNGGRT